MDTLKNALEQFGLNEKESSIYLACLDLGVASAQEIAKRAGIQRTYFYDLGRKLITAGLIKETKEGNKRAYTATDPEQLAEEQKRKLQRIERLLPEFKAIQNTAGRKPKVFYYDETAGIDYINDDTLRYGGEIVAFTTPRFLSGGTRSTGNDFIRKRVNRGIKARVIGEASPDMERLRERDSSELRETRILSPSVYSSAVEVTIYGDRISIVDYKARWGLIVESGEISQVMKMLFEIVWGRWKEN